jgi:hypothetical protein
VKPRRGSPASGGDAASRGEAGVVEMLRMGVVREGFPSLPVDF